MSHVSTPDALRWAKEKRRAMGERIAELRKHGDSDALQQFLHAHGAMGRLIFEANRVQRAAEDPPVARANGHAVMRGVTFFRADEPGRDADYWRARCPRYDALVLTAVVTARARRAP